MTLREQLLEDLIIFVCERTGLTRQDVCAVFDADQDFWMTHQQSVAQLNTEDEDL